MMRHGAATYNALGFVAVDGTISIKTTEGTAHSAASPLLARYTSGAVLELSASPTTIQITSATTFGLPAYFQGAALPINIGIARTGATTGVIVASRDTPPFTTCDGNPTTDIEGVLSGVALSGAETIWPWVITGYRMANGVWDFSAAAFGDGV